MANPQDNRPPPHAPKAPRGATKGGSCLGVDRNTRGIVVSVSPRGRGDFHESTSGKSNLDSTSAPSTEERSTKHTSGGVKRHKLAYQMTRYLRPIGPFVVDQNDLFPGTGMQRVDTFCLHCGRTLRPYGILHLKKDGSCPYDCSHCKTSDHQGQLCPRLWLSQSFQRRHGLHMSVQPNLQVRPSPEDLRVIAHDYPQYRNFADSVLPVGNKKEPEPKKRQAPEEPSKSGGPAQKRKQQDFAEIEARMKVMEELIRIQAGEIKELKEAFAEVEVPAYKMLNAVVSPPQSSDRGATDREPSVDALLEQALQEEAVLYARTKGGQQRRRGVEKKGLEEDAAKEKAGIGIPKLGVL